LAVDDLALAHNLALTSAWVRSLKEITMPVLRQVALLNIGFNLLSFLFGFINTRFVKLQLSRIVVDLLFRGGKK
jgi:hypothetical protein